MDFILSDKQKDTRGMRYLLFIHNEILVLSRTRYNQYADHGCQNTKYHFLPQRK